MKSAIITLLVFLGAIMTMNADAAVGKCVNVTTPDIALVQDAFTHGYTHNEVIDIIDGKPYPTLTIQCVNNGVHQPHSDEIKGFSSVWTRDLYWGALGWVQAGDDKVVTRMKTSIEALIACKNRNKAEGKSKTWPLNDGRYCIPQAYVPGGTIAMDFFPYCSESQVDFLLYVHLYWQMSGDTDFVKQIWNDIAYVTQTIELMDTNGNSLPDNCWGSYDYQYVGQDMEEPLLSAKASAAYKAVSEMAKALDKNDESKRLQLLSNKVKKTMNLPISDGGLWYPEGGHFANKRIITKGKESIDGDFIPYENLGPMFYGITSRAQNKAIFDKLDANFNAFYPLKYGPLYTSHALVNENSEIDRATTPWLGFIDVYLRCKLGHANNRSEIFSLLIKHAYDIPAAPFTEGVGIYGKLTGGAGRSWDNGNFFHCLISGIYGIEKSAKGIIVTAPVKMADFPLTELNNVCWRDAVYDFKWQGNGSRISEVTVDGKPRHLTNSGMFMLTDKDGKHQVVINMQ